MRILVGEHMMHPCQSVQTKALIIYHELTHKILGTLDKGLGFLGDGTIGTKPIFGEESVQQMAKDFPEKTLLVAGQSCKRRIALMQQDPHLVDGKLSGGY